MSKLQFGDWHLHTLSWSYFLKGDWVRRNRKHAQVDGPAACVNHDDPLRRGLLRCPLAEVMWGVKVKGSFAFWYHVDTWLPLVFTRNEAGTHNRHMVHGLLFTPAARISENIFDGALDR